MEVIFMEISLVDKIVLVIIFILAIIISIIFNHNPEKKLKRALVIRWALRAGGYYKKTFELLLKEAKELKNKK